MPVNDNQFRAALQWFNGGSSFRERMDFLWDGLTGSQQTGLVARIKSDLDADFDEEVARTQAQKTDITGSL